MIRCATRSAEELLQPGARDLLGLPGRFDPDRPAAVALLELGEQRPVVRADVDHQVVLVDGELGGQVVEVVVQLAAVAGRVRIVRREHLGRVDDHTELNEGAVIAAIAAGADSASRRCAVRRPRRMLHVGGLEPRSSTRSEFAAAAAGHNDPRCRRHAADRLVGAIPLERRLEPVRQRPARPVAEPPELPGVRPPAPRGPCRQFARDDLDGAAKAGGHQFGERADRVLLVHVAEVVDVAVLALVEQHHQPVDAVVDVAEAAGLLPRPLDREAGLPRRQLDEPAGELGDDVVPAHVRAVDVVRPDDDRAAQDAGLAVGQRGELRRDLAAAVAVARVGDVRDRQRHRLVGRVVRRRRVLVGLGRRHQDQFGPVGVQFGDPEHVHDPGQRDVDDVLGVGVERLGALHVGEVPDHVRAGPRQGRWRGSGCRP